MFIYLDESGDTGFEFQRGSSRYFIIALVLVDDPIPLNEAIQDLHAQLHMPPQWEFKFSSTNNQTKAAFFQTVRPFDFAIRSLVVDKTILYSPHLRKRTDFYQHFVMQVLRNDFGAIDDAILVIDESFKGKKHKDSMEYYLKRSVNSPGTRKINKVIYHPSHTDNLIQLADMVSGAMYRKWQHNDAQYTKLLRRHIKDEWCFE